MEEIKSEIEAKIEKAQNFYEGMVISAIYKNENNKIDLIVLDDTQPGTKAFAKLEYISSLPRCMQPSTSNGLGIWEYYDSPLFRQA
ncbi:MAG: hypothetical protein HWD61_08805 [Parachlamydiaceae bacterium]|nr:MAG: hypothetical protein HWD61_08805 [Parachlamydiaceae bacterium]